MSESLINKHEPDAISDITNNEVRLLVESGQALPNMLFVGHPGTGKTTAATLIAKHILGHAVGLNFFEFNSSNDRGIDFVRGDLREICRGSSQFNPKVILLDEADGMTNDAQSCLKRIIELHPHCVFIFTANNEARLQAAIKSRLSTFRFEKASTDVLKGICEDATKDSPLTDEDLEKVVKYADGDIRRLFHGIELLRSGAVLGSEVSSILKMKVRDFIDLTYREMPGYIIQRMHDEIIALGSTNALIELADLDYKCSLPSYKVLQLQAGFIKINRVLNVKKDK